MAIQMRRGADKDFDPEKTLPGELAVTTDGTRKVYASFGPGDVKELAKQEDVNKINQKTTNLKDEISSLKGDISQIFEDIANLPSGGTSVYIGDTKPTDGILYWLDISEDTTVEPEEPEVTLTSIFATYTGGEVAVGTALTALTGITVTGTYSDGSTATITGYTLSGTITEGSNTITVSYGGKTTTFTVTGVAESGGDATDISALILNEPYLVDEETVANDWDGYNYDFVTGANKNNTPTVCASAIVNQTPITDYFNSSYDVLYGVVYYPNRSDEYGTVSANLWAIQAYKDNYGAPGLQEVANCAFTRTYTSDYKCYSYKLVKEDVISAIEATDYTQDDILKIGLKNQSNNKNTGLKSFWMATEPTMEQLEAIRDFFANGGEL